MNAKQSPNLAADGIPQPGECSPLYYQAMTAEQRAEYDAACDREASQRDDLSQEILDAWPDMNILQKIALTVAVKFFRLIESICKLTVKAAHG